MLAEFDDTDENQVVALNSIIIIKKGGEGGAQMHTTKEFFSWRHGLESNSTT